MTIGVPDLAQLPRCSALIGGEAGQGSGAEVAHIYPATGAATADIRLSSPVDVERAVIAARDAAPAWRALPGDKRRDLMFALAAAIEADIARLAHLSTIENGSTAMTAPYMASDAAQKFRYFGGWADKIHGRTVSTWGGPAHD